MSKYALALMFTWMKTKCSLNHHFEKGFSFVTICTFSVNMHFTDSRRRTSIFTRSKSLVLKKITVFLTVFYTSSKFELSDLIRRTFLNNLVQNLSKTWKVFWQNFDLCLVQTMFVPSSEGFNIFDSRCFNGWKMMDPKQSRVTYSIAVCLCLNLISY